MNVGDPRQVATCLRCKLPMDLAAERRAFQAKGPVGAKKGRSFAGKHRLARIAAFEGKQRRTAEKRKARRKLAKRHGR